LHALQKDLVKRIEKEKSYQTTLKDKSLKTAENSRRQSSMKDRSLSRSEATKRESPYQEFTDDIMKKVQTDIQRRFLKEKPI